MAASKVTPALPRAQPTDLRREQLRQEIFRSILETLKTIPSYRHASFVSAVLGELIESDRQPLDLLLDAVDRARLTARQP
jgi:hypothetical protein